MYVRTRARARVLASGGGVVVIVIVIVVFVGEAIISVVHRVNVSCLNQSRVNIRAHY